MRIEPKVNIKYKLDDGSGIVLNILDAKTKHLEQYVATLTPNKTLEVLKELRNALRKANEEIDRLEYLDRKENDLENEISSLEDEIDDLKREIDELEYEIIALKERNNNA